MIYVSNIIHTNQILCAEQNIRLFYVNFFRCYFYGATTSSGRFKNIFLRKESKRKKIWLFWIKYTSIFALIVQIEEILRKTNHNIVHSKERSIFLYFSHAFSLETRNLLSDLGT